MSMTCYHANPKLCKVQNIVKSDGQVIKYYSVNSIGQMLCNNAFLEFVLPRSWRNIVSGIDTQLSNLKP